MDLVGRAPSSNFVFFSYSLSILSFGRSNLGSSQLGSEDTGMATRTGDKNGRSRVVVDANPDRQFCHPPDPLWNPAHLPHSPGPVYSRVCQRQRHCLLHRLPHRPYSIIAQPITAFQCPPTHILLRDTPAHIFPIPFPLDFPSNQFPFAGRR